jgi:hypothetical protein
MDRDKVVFGLGFVVLIGVFFGSLLVMSSVVPMVSLDGDYGETDVFIEGDDSDYLISDVSRLENGSLLGEVSFRGDVGYKGSIGGGVEYYVVDYGGDVVESGSDRFVFREDGVKEWSTVISDSGDVETILFDYSVNRQPFYSLIASFVPIFGFILLTFYTLYVPRYFFGEDS